MTKEDRVDWYLSKMHLLAFISGKISTELRIPGKLQNSIRRYLRLEARFKRECLK